MAKCNKLTPLPFKGLIRPTAVTGQVAGVTNWGGVVVGQQNYPH